MTYIIATFKEYSNGKVDFNRKITENELAKKLNVNVIKLHGFLKDLQEKEFILIQEIDDDTKLIIVMHGGEF